MSFSVNPVHKTSGEWSDITKLFYVTDPYNLGHGRDVKEVTKYTGLTPALAWRISAPSREKRYNAAKEEIADGLSAMGLKVPDVVTKLDSTADALFESRLDRSVNEKVLLHGTRPEAILSLLQNGISERLSSGLFGNGSYLAEDPSKIDQYCTQDTDQHADDKLHTILFKQFDLQPLSGMFYGLVCRVALGYPVFTKDGNTNLNKPFNDAFVDESKRELPLIPEGGDLPVRYHSLIAEAGPSAMGYLCARHREFVVFDSSRIMEAYIVAYIRDIVSEPVQLTSNFLNAFNAAEDPATQAELSKMGADDPHPLELTEMEDADDWELQRRRMQLTDALQPPSQQSMGKAADDQNQNQNQISNADNLALPPPSQQSMGKEPEPESSGPRADGLIPTQDFDGCWACLCPPACGAIFSQEATGPDSFARRGYLMAGPCPVSAFATEFRRMEGTNGFKASDGSKSWYSSADSVRNGWCNGRNCSRKICPRPYERMETKALEGCWCTTTVPIPWISALYCLTSKGADKIRVEGSIFLCCVIPVPCANGLTRKDSYRLNKFDINGQNQSLTFYSRCFNIGMTKDNKSGLITVGLCSCPLCCPKETKPKD